MMLVTFPRSGAHLTKHMVMQQLDYELGTSHKYYESKGKVITIARDPSDSIRSYIVMTGHYGNQLDIKGVISYYATFYRYMYTRADVVIDYDTLLNSPDLVIDKIAKELDLKPNGKPYISTLVDKPHREHLVSSKTSELYDPNMLDGHNLIKAYEAYNKLLSRKTV